MIYLVSLIALQGAGIDKMTVLGFDNAPVAVWIATAIGFLIRVFVSFLLNSRFVFKLEEGKSRSFGKALLKTYLSYGVTGIVLNPVLNTVWVSVCHISDRIAPLISLVICQQNYADSHDSSSIILVIHYSTIYFTIQKGIDRKSTRLEEGVHK